MRLKKRAILISTTISLISVSLSLLFFILSNNKPDNKTFSFLFTAISGIWGSSCAVLLFSIFEYFQAKKDSMRLFGRAVDEALTSFYNIEYLLVHENEETVFEAIRESEDRPYVDKMKKDMAEEGLNVVNNPNFIAFTDKTVYQKKLADEIKQNDINKFPPELNVTFPDKFYYDKAERETEEYIKRVKRILNQYHAAAHMDLSKLQDVFYDIDFFSDIFKKQSEKKKFRLEQEIISPIRNEVKLISKTSVQFSSLYPPDNCYCAYEFRNIMELQNTLYRPEQRKFGEIETTCYIPFFANGIRKNLYTNWINRKVHLIKENNNGNKETDRGGSTT